jgi:hypothetical protein
VSEAELKAIVDKLADIACVLDDADPADKAEIFRRLGLKLTYHPGQRLVQATVEPAQYGFFDSPKTELNPHKAVEAASRARTDQTGLPSSGQSPPARQLGKGGAVTPPVIRCAHDAPLPPRAELAHA